MRLDPSVERLAQLWQLGSQDAAGQLGEDVWITLAIEHCCQHSPAAHTKNIADHGCELDVGTLQRLLQSVRLVNPLLDQCFPVAGQLTNGSKWRWRNEARPQQPVPQQIGQPLAIANVRLLSWNRTHML